MMTAMRCICDGIFKSLANDVGLSTNVGAVITMAQNAVATISDMVPFADNGSLSSHMSIIEGVIQNSYVPSISSERELWNNQDGSKTKKTIFAAYYPYFVFTYILSFIPFTNKGARSGARKGVSFADVRLAKLCSYLFMMHTISALYDRMPTGSDSSCNTECTSHKTFIKQMFDNILFNVLGREEKQVQEAKPVYTNSARVLSQSNQLLSNDLVTINQRYDMYKQNLAAAASSEQALRRRLNTITSWYWFNKWIAAILVPALIVLLLLPPAPWNTNLTYGLSAGAMAYATIVALVLAIRGL